MKRGLILSALTVALAATPALAGADEAPAAPAPESHAPAPDAEPAAAAEPAPEALGAPVPADARTWRYQGVIEHIGDDGSTNEKKIDVDLVEAGRRTVNGRVVVDLLAARGGRRLTSDAVAELSPAPFRTFAPSLSVVYGKKKEPMIWLIMSDAPATEAEIAEATKGRPTFRTAKRLPPRAKITMKPDTWLHWSDKVGSWESSCGGEEHPSPDSGDFYTSTICYAPATGITRIDFDSVWGSVDLVLATRPADPKLPN